MFKKIRFTVLSLLFLLIISGCKEEVSEAKKNVPKEEGTIVIATIIPEFTSSITDFYNKDNKYNIEVRTILNSAEEVNKHWTDLDTVIDNYLQDNKDIDIVYGFPTEYLTGLIDKGNIKSLNGLIQKDLLKKMAPAILEPVKLAGKGDVFAVSPYFNNQVLVYNKKIFNETGIDEPNNGMNWEDASNLANSIQKSSKYKGISLGMPTSEVEFYYLYQNLSRPIYNIGIEKGKTIVNTKLNKKYWTLFTNLYNDNSKATLEEYVKGEVAMAVLPVSLLFDKEYLNFYGDYEPSDWGLVDIPIFEENKGGHAFTDSLFVVSKYSNNKEAINFLNYINGKNYAEGLIELGMIPTYWDSDIKNKLLEQHGYDLTPIYNQPGELLNKPTLEGEEYLQVQSAGETYFTNYLTGRVNINDSLADYEKFLNK